MSVYVSVCLSLSLILSLSVFLSVGLSVPLSVCLCTCLSVCLSVRLSVCLYFCLSVCLSVCPHVSLSVYTLNQHCRSNVIWINQGQTKVIPFSFVFWYSPLDWRSPWLIDERYYPTGQTKVTKVIPNYLFFFRHTLPHPLLHH